MKRVTAAVVLFTMFLSAPVMALETADVKKFVTENSKDPSLVTQVESRTSKRWLKVAGGAALGAAAGAAHAALTGGDMAKDALIGAVAGGAIAFAVTKYQEKRLADRSQVATEIAYDESKGYVAGADASVPSGGVAAGENLPVKVTYYAIGPDAKEKINTSRYAAIATESGRMLKGFYFAPDPFVVQGGGGKYETTMEISLKGADGKAIDPGTYTFVWVLDGQAQEMATSSFVVKG